MPSAVEVVSQIQGKSVAQIAFDADIDLLRIGINEILGLRIAKWLEGERQEVVG